MGWRNLQLLEASELGSEAALGGGVNNKDDLALVLGQRLVSALFCEAKGNQLVSTILFCSDLRSRVGGHG